MKSTIGIVMMALACACATAAYAENSRLILTFGGSPGDKLAHAYDYGLPDDAGEVYTMRIPVIKPEMAKVFYDTKLTITAPDKIVRRVEAERAFKSLQACDESLEIVEKKLVEALPNPYTGSGAWLYQSADRRAAGLVTCSKGSKHPFIVLRLLIAEPD